MTELERMRKALDLMNDWDGGSYAVGRVFSYVRPLVVGRVLVLELEEDRRRRADLEGDDDGP